MRLFPLHLALRCLHSCGWERVPLEEVDAQDLGGAHSVEQLEATLVWVAYGAEEGVLRRLGHAEWQPLSQLRWDESCGPAEMIPSEAE
jgi:hypothetical protein